MMDTLRLLIRLLIAWVFLRNGTDVLRNPEPRANTAGWLLQRIRAFVPFLPEDDVLLVRANAAVHVGAAGLLALNVQPRLAALALAASLVPTTVGGHAFWQHEDPTRRAQNQINFEKNLAILGGLLTSALFGEQHRRRRFR